MEDLRTTGLGSGLINLTSLCAGIYQTNSGTAGLGSAVDRLNNARVVKINPARHCMASHSNFVHPPVNTPALTLRALPFIAYYEQTSLHTEGVVNSEPSTRLMNEVSDEGKVWIPQI